MKYSQYHEARELFESDLAQSYGYDLNEWDSLPPGEKAEQLNEILGIAGLTTALLGKIGIGAGAALVGLGVAFRKRIAQNIRMKRYLKKLRNESVKFKAEALKGLAKAIAPQLEAKKKIKANEGVDSWKELSDDSKKKVFRIEEKIANALTDYVNKVTKLKTQQIYSTIESSKKLSEATKLALQFSWETMAAETKVGLLAELMKEKVIESPQVIAEMDDSMEAEKAELARKEKDTVSKIKSMGEKDSKKSLESFKDDAENEDDKEALVKLYNDLKKADHIEQEDKREVFKILKDKGIAPKKGEGEIYSDEI